MNDRVTMFVAAIIGGWLPPDECDASLFSKEDIEKVITTKAKAVVHLAIRLDQLLAEHELRQLIPPSEMKVVETSQKATQVMCPACHGIHVSRIADFYQCLDCGKLWKWLIP